MFLMEHDAKSLLSRGGITGPDGLLVTGMASFPSPQVNGSGWIVKAQILAIGRGKPGGIRMGSAWAGARNIQVILSAEGGVESEALHRSGGSVRSGQASWTAHLARRGIAQSVRVSIDGDPVKGTRFADLVPCYAGDKATRALCHAGAMVYGSVDTFGSRLAALRTASVHVARSLTGLERHMERGPW